MKRSLVIIGGVAAGPKMAAKARREDGEVPIALVTDEPVISYAGCGTPYYLGRTFDQREKLLVREPEDFAAKNNVTVLTRHRATRIDRENHLVVVTNLATGEEQQLPYSKLGLALGARPFVPPIPNADAKGVSTLRSVTDAFAIDDYLNDHAVKHATVVGAGFIGVEVVEQFRRRGIEVTLIELMNQILPPLDEAPAVAARRDLERMGVEVLLETKLEGLDVGHDGRVTGVRTTRGPIRTEFVLLGVGVRPNAELAAEAGLKLGTTGAIWVNPRMQTSDPDIYAAGDCAEQTHLVSGLPVWVPLGSTANKQGRVAAVNMTGGYDTFPGVLGTALVRVGELNIGRTGLQQRDLERAAIEYESCIVPQGDRPGYMPGAAEIVLLLHADRRSRKVLGAQCWGPGDVAKRIDILATAITAGMTVDEVGNLDLGYAPPYAPAMDVVLTAANVLETKLDQATAGVMPCRLKRDPDLDQKVLLDCREPEEFAKERLAGARLMPLGTIDQRCQELDPEREVVVYCKGGLRSAEAYRKLRRAGFKKVRYLDGGMTAWCGHKEC